MIATAEPRPADRYYALDALRGVAALSVVMYHWQHFFERTSESVPPVGSTAMPAYRMLAPLYDYGYLAVDLFFVISGFVFFRLYGDKVASGLVGARTFAVRRLSRLYPLYLVTLLAVAAGQWVRMRTTGMYFHTYYNDARHFALSLFMASSWGFERDMSFNGPAWSVSVEIVLYAAFFLFARYAPRRIWAMVIAGAAARLIFHGYFPLGRGLSEFFIGGVIAEIDRDVAIGRHTWLRPAAVIACVVLWTATLTWIYEPAVLRGAFVAVPRLSTAVSRFGLNWARIVLMPLTVLAVLSVDAWLGARLRRVEWLGDISYSSYLIHFPLQLAFVLALGPGLATWREQPSSIAIFLGALVLLSLVSYHAFERPTQDWLRRRLIRSEV